MSLETWKAEFYPQPADEVPADEAVAHSLQKWKGMRPENLERHGVDAEWSYLAFEDQTLGIDASTCALCKHFARGSCLKCPLAIVRGGVACDMRREDEARPYGCSPFHKWATIGDPEPMIKWLEKALPLETSPTSL